MILSPSLSWLESYNPPYDTVVDVIRWCIRRALIHPYLRSHTLATTVMQDVCQIMGGGRRTVLRCLLQLHGIMERSESHYLFNKLFIDPLICWAQRCNESDVKSFAKEVEASLVHAGKEHLGLGLAELELSFFDYCDDDEVSSSSEEDGDETDDYESDSDSRGADETTVGTSIDEEVDKVKDEREETIKKTASKASSALLDENIGDDKSASGLGILGSSTGGVDGGGQPCSQPLVTPLSEKKLIEEA